MDYSSQDSNPIDFSKSNKDLVHNNVSTTLHAVAEEELDRRVVIPVVRREITDRNRKDLT